ncbi:hypothetical protein ILYODFUR_002955 [Ilyodon furcidens]|uniref:Uncharacterized protein n=1 Tax=Ilyodon furcidens TaxID=33524 RepID=A0ABV0TFJ6_9TELE
MGVVWKILWKDMRRHILHRCQAAEAMLPKPDQTILDIYSFIQASNPQSVQHALNKLATVGRPLSRALCLETFSNKMVLTRERSDHLRASASCMISSSTTRGTQEEVCSESTQSTADSITQCRHELLLNSDRT